MRYEVKISEEGIKDLKKIYEYIAIFLSQPQAALNQLKRIEKGIMSLDIMPERFKAFEREPWQSRGLRQMVIDNFIVFYIPDNQRALVTVIRVIYSGRNIEKVL